MTYTYHIEERVFHLDGTPLKVVFLRVYRDDYLFWVIPLCDRWDEAVTPNCQWSDKLVDVIEVAKDELKDRGIIPH